MKRINQKISAALLALVMLPWSVNAKSWELSDEKINPLMAGDVCQAVGLKETLGGRKRMGVNGWSKPDQVLSWPVTSSSSGACEVTLLVNAPQVGTSFTLSSGVESIEIKATERGWQRVSGMLKIGKGQDTISLKLSKALAGRNKAQIVSIEVVTATHLPAHKKRLAQVKSSQGDTAWFHDAGFGLMFQWGNWGYPAKGEKKSPWNKVYEDFDIEVFADKMKSFDPGYIIWSITWRGSRFSAPLKSVDKIMGSKEFTMEYDFLGKLTDALTKRGIPVILYYHPGAEEPEFWKTVWKGQDDRMPFEDANVAIWSEIGERLGNKLSGWFVDDGMVQYYPADFGRYIKALKMGNPKRLVSFNPWKFPICSPYEDMSMGEGHIKGEIKNNRLVSGPSEGLLAHYMDVMDGHWGLWKPNTVIGTPKGGTKYWQKKIDDAKRRGHPVSFCLMMYEDGTLGTKTEVILKKLKR